MSSLTGGCSCGKVRYECEPKIIASFICHCDACKKASGSAFGVVAFIKEKHLTIEGEASFHQKLGSFGNPVYRGYCSNCHNPVFGHSDTLPGVIGIAVGSLDNPNDITPQAHCWTSKKVDWVHINDDLPQYPESPEFR